MESQLLMQDSLFWRKKREAAIHLKNILQQESKHIEARFLLG